MMTDAVNEIKQTLKPTFRRPYLTVNLQNCLAIKGLYDTGADISCLSEKFFRQLPPIIDLQSYKLKLSPNSKQLEASLQKFEAATTFV
jgi:hypothetical protein